MELQLYPLWSSSSSDPSLLQSFSLPLSIMQRIYRKMPKAPKTIKYIGMFDCILHCFLYCNPKKVTLIQKRFSINQTLC